MQPVALVIESVGQQDLVEGRAEGQALCSAMQLAGLPYFYYQANSLADLKEIFSDITAKFPYNVMIDPATNRQLLLVPCFHISAHGDQDGIRLTSREFVSWKGLRDMFIQFGQGTGRMVEDICMIQVSFSTCEGAYARKMFEFGSPWPCIVVIGPEEKVEWSAAITAYVTLYHLEFNKDKFGPDCVPIMNQAAGLDNVFQYYLCPGGRQVQRPGHSS